MKAEYLQSDERLDDLENGLFVIQKPDKFCFGVDAVLLSHFAKNATGEVLVDLCTGSGVVPILLSAKTKIKKLYGIELQESIAKMAERSVLYNDLSARVHIIQADIKEVTGYIPKDSVDVVTVNPPYMADTHGLKNPDTELAIARHEIYATLEDVVRESTKLLRVGGKFFMVHRPQRMAQIFKTLEKYKIEPKRLQMVQPYRDREANLMLVEGTKHGRSFMHIEPTLVIYEKAGIYTKEVLEIYGK